MYSIYLITLLWFFCQKTFKIIIKLTQAIRLLFPPPHPKQYLSFGRGILGSLLGSCHYLAFQKGKCRGDLSNFFMVLPNPFYDRPFVTFGSNVGTLGGGKHYINQQGYPTSPESFNFYKLYLFLFDLLLFLFFLNIFCQL